MGILLFLFVALPLCIVLIVKRARRKRSFVVPLTLLALAFIGAVLSFAHIVHVFAGVAGVAPEDKATLLAKGISEMLHESALWLLADVLIVGVAIFADRGLARRADRARTSARALAGSIRT